MLLPALMQVVSRRWPPACLTNRFISYNGVCNGQPVTLLGVDDRAVRLPVFGRMPNPAQYCLTGDEKPMRILQYRNEGAP